MAPNCSKTIEVNLPWRLLKTLGNKAELLSSTTLYMREGAFLLMLLRGLFLMLCLLHNIVCTTTYMKMEWAHETLWAFPDFFPLTCAYFCGDLGTIRMWQKKSLNASAAEHSHIHVQDLKSANRKTGPRKWFFVSVFRKHWPFFGNYPEGRRVETYFGDGIEHEHIINYLKHRALMRFYIMRKFKSCSWGVN